jgi:hypothetical protein
MEENLMPEFSAVMIIGHFVVSLFQVPLGQPLYQFVPYPSMERCQEYSQYLQTPSGGHTMSLEYKMYKTIECISKEEFEREMKKMQQQNNNSGDTETDNWN